MLYMCKNYNIKSFNFKPVGGMHPQHPQQCIRACLHMPTTVSVGDQALAHNKPDGSHDLKQKGRPCMMHT